MRITIPCPAAGREGIAADSPRPLDCLLSKPPLVMVRPQMTPISKDAPKMTAGFGAGMSARDFINPTAGRAGSAETAEPRGSTSTGNPEE